MLHYFESIANLNASIFYHHHPVSTTGILYSVAMGSQLSYRLAIRPRTICDYNENCQNSKCENNVVPSILGEFVHGRHGA